jgi:signal transduction histidine kinase
VGEPAGAYGRADRALDRLYERLGIRIMWVILGGGAVFGLLTALGANLFVARYLSLPASAAVHVMLLQLLVLGPIGLLVFLSCRRQVQTIFAWSGAGRTAERAPKTWYALLDHPRLTIRPAIATSMLMLPSAFYWVGHYHRHWWGAVPLAIGGATAIASWAALVIFAADLIGRPLRADVAAHLPPDFEPRLDGISLRLKTLAPMPILALGCAIFAGAYANLSHDGLVRYTIALGAALVIVAVASATFFVINRSALRPVDDLVAATNRVREGDLDRPVPVVSADELGTLAHSFNQMLDGLRDRESLRDELLKREEELRESRARIVAASDAERRRVERNIHDGAQQRLVALSLELRLLEQAATAARAPELQAMAAEAFDNLKEALNELRELARGLHPAVLGTDGLGPALRQLASRSPIPVTVSAPAERLPELVESTIYFVASEALANVAKYSQASSASLLIRRCGRRVELQVSDDGVGGAVLGSGSGLTGLADRVAALDGTLAIESPRGAGTTLTAEIPLSPEERS